MISVDTTILKELASASSVATDAIDNAVDALNRISVHNDWGCREKNAINNYAITNKNKIRQLQENSRSFLNVITQVSNEFETSENSIMDLFSSVESLLSGMLGIPTIITGGITHTGHNQLFNSNFTEIIKEFNKTLFSPGYVATPDKISEMGAMYKNGTDYLGKYAADNLTEPLSVCKFDDINLE